jgi:hypothetical protein
LDGENKSMDKSWRGTIDSNSNNSFAGICNGGTLKDGITTDDINSILGIKREPCWNIYLFLLKKLSISLINKTKPNYEK